MNRIFLFHNWNFIHIAMYDIGNQNNEKDERNEEITETPSFFPIIQIITSHIFLFIF